MSFENTGRVWTPNSLKSYLQTLAKPKFANCVVLHHTAAPSLAQRPRGLTIQHIENIQSFYSKEMRWTRGPHFFIDEDQIFGMTPPTVSGIHAVSFNRRSIGIEVLGDYDTEDPLTGRGLQCWETAAEAVAILVDWLGLEVNEKTILFHRDDPLTRKSCPGTKVTKKWLIDLINSKTVKAPVITDSATTTVNDIVPIVDYLILNKGYTTNEAVQGLKTVNNVITFYDVPIPSGRYNTQLSASTATVEDLRKLKSK